MGAGIHALAAPRRAFVRGSSRPALAASAAGALLLAGTIAVAPSAAAGVVVSASQQAHAAVPGASLEDVFRLRILNTGARSETLRYMAFENRTIGPGSVAELDGDWTEIYLIRDKAANDQGMLDAGETTSRPWGNNGGPAAGEPDGPGRRGSARAPSAGEPDAPGTVGNTLPAYHSAKFENDIAVFTDLDFIIASSDSLVLRNPTDLRTLGYLARAHEQLARTRAISADGP
jgi:hypothetical protein